MNSTRNRGIAFPLSTLLHPVSFVISALHSSFSRLTLKYLNLSPNNRLVLRTDKSKPVLLPRHALALLQSRHHNHLVVRVEDHALVRPQEIGRQRRHGSPGAGIAPHDAHDSLVRDGEGFLDAVIDRVDVSPGLLVDGRDRGLMRRVGSQTTTCTSDETMTALMKMTYD